MGYNRENEIPFGLRSLTTADFELLRLATLSTIEYRRYYTRYREPSYATVRVSDGQSYVGRKGESVSPTGMSTCVSVGLIDLKGKVAGVTHLTTQSDPNLVQQMIDRMSPDGRKLRSVVLGGFANSPASSLLTARALRILHGNAVPVVFSDVLRMGGDAFKVAGYHIDPARGYIGIHTPELTTGIQLTEPFSLIGAISSLLSHVPRRRSAVR